MDYLVFDIGGTFIKYALMQENGAMLEKGKVPSPTQDMDAFLAALAGIGARFRGRYGAAAVSVPGCIDTARGIAITGGAFAFLHDTPLAALLTKELGVPVTLANDAHCAANAEAWNGALAGVQDGCVVVLGTGIGGGIVLGGRVLVGSSFSAGQFSALPTDYDRVWHGMLTPESDGLYHLWTGQVSASSLLHDYAQRRGAPEQELDGIKFFAAYDTGDPDAKETLALFGRRAAAGIYSIQAVLDLERFAIGGGISARPEVTRIIRDSLDELFRRIPATPFAKPEVVPCRFGNDANLIGALRFAVCAHSR